MKLIDRYIYVVTERLPKDMREDVSRELRANIEDMVPENPTEDDVREALLNLGNPIKLASEYNQTKRYLIGPSLYDSYFSVLKLVLGIVVTVFVSIALIDGIFSTSVNTSVLEMVIKISVKTSIAAGQGIIQGVLWVTLAFVILERTGVNEGKVPFVKKEWSPEDLLKVPVSDKGKISRGETVFSMFCTIFFTALVYFRPQLIGIYVKGEKGIRQATSLFDIEGIRSYIFIIIVLAIMQLGIFIWKFIARHWNTPLAVANASLNVGLCILVIVMFKDNSLFNPEFLSNISYYTTTNITKIISIWSWSIKITMVSFIGICLWDSINAFIKCKR